MQFLEHSVIGLRAACYTLRSRMFGTEITLFPMVHLGENGFFSRFMPKRWAMILFWSRA